MRFRLRETWVGLRNSRTRIPFRYGKTCLSVCPQAVLEARVEVQGVGVVAGFSGDCLPPSWFDKRAGVSYERQIGELVASIRAAERAFSEATPRPATFFQAWLRAGETIRAWGAEQNLPSLVASFGGSMVERAILDALARVAGLPLAEAFRANIYGVEAGEVHQELKGRHPADWLPAVPLAEVWVRHTVGLGDPLTVGEIAAEDRVKDRLPQALEEHVRTTGVCYFKVKLRNELERDRDRLRDFASVVERHRGADYALTLDGNEQYPAAEAFGEFLEMLDETPELARLRRNVLAIEQPLERGVALERGNAEGLTGRCGSIPVLIDESDATIESFHTAYGLGYRGVSSKNCKGAIKSLLNAGLVAHWNREKETRSCLMTGEDLCTVGVVPVQSDLCLAAALGLEHVERNGHHYHPGLSYLPVERQRAALAAHPDFYGEEGGVIGPRVKEGRVRIRSLQCAGYGFAVLPERVDYVEPERWRFESLELPDD